MSKLYGSLSNRLEEGKRFVDEIKVGDGVTMYYWSDRKAYEITQVVDQKHFFMRQYDAKHIGEAFSNQWKLVSNENNPEIEVMFRNNTWKSVRRFKKEEVEKYVDSMTECKTREANYSLYRHYNQLTDKDIEKMESGKEVVKYYKMEPISIGVADYYYDYEF